MFVQREPRARGPDAEAPPSNAADRPPPQAAAARIGPDVPFPGQGGGGPVAAPQVDSGPARDVRAPPPTDAPEPPLPQPVKFKKIPMT
jgi:hypothetical protein